MRNLFIWLAGAFMSLSLLSQAQVCTSKQYDMLNWMAPALETANGHSNVILPESGIFYWLKTDKGYPWDVRSFDQNFIYNLRTEWYWNDPYTFKAQETPRRIMPRCVDIPSASGKLASIALTPAQAWYDIHSSCTAFTRHTLGYTINEIWGPDNYSIGGQLAVPTLELRYRYGCDSQYSVCNYKETYELQLSGGMMRWTYYIWSNGEWVEQNQTVHGALQLSTVQPFDPCFLP